MFSSATGAALAADEVVYSRQGRVVDHRVDVDRLTFHAHIIETGTESYRLRTTRAGKGSRQKTA